MPYISAKDDRREKLRNREPALNAGELNYQIFYYIKHRYNEPGELRRKTIKDFRDLIGLKFKRDPYIIE